MTHDSMKDRRLDLLLRQHMASRRYHLTPGLLAKMSGVSKATLVNWLEGRVTRPRRWQDMVMVADALRLTADEASELLSTVGHPDLLQLAKEASENDRELFLLWPELTSKRVPLDEAETVPSPPFATVPSIRTSFIGRRQNREDLIDLCRDTTLPIVSVIGPAGVGKSRLAIEVAHTVSTHRRPVVYVPLCQMNEGPQVLTGIALALGIQHTQGDLLAKVLEKIADCELLLLLDNVDTVIESVASTVSFLTQASAARFLLTSRTVLRVGTEQQFVVHPLMTRQDGDRHSAISEAAQLFEDRARSVDASFAITRWNKQSVEQICDQLDGLPLSIELAAARIKLFAPHALLRRLDRRMNMLTWSMSDGLDHQSSLRATLEWSVARLRDSAQSAFMLLASLPGGISLDIAASAFKNNEAGRTLYDDVMYLVDHSLLQKGHDADRNARFFLLRTMREYADDMARRQGQTDTNRDLLVHYVQSVVSFVCAAPQDESSAVSALLDSEYPNVLAAIDWCERRGDHAVTGSIETSLADYLMTRGHQFITRKSAPEGAFTTNGKTVST
jgi:predicted ATPase